MAIKTTFRRRLAAGATGTILVMGLVLGNVSVAADGDQPESHDVNIGKDATGMADQPIYSINSVTVTRVVSAPVQATALTEDTQVFNQHNHDDNQNADAHDDD